MNSYNDPLIYIKGPPVFHLPPREKVDIQMEEQEIDQEIEQDESTSIYEIRSSMTDKTIVILEKLKFLEKPFQRKVYRPLVFHLEDGVHLQGEVEKVEGEFVTFFIGAGELMRYRVDQVKRIVWRGVEMK
ncbi:hypothetical protein [Psychrobacillus soli]|uniref:Uncharacterized protein n=1 Tax=Psychrobacillus soli TaxID=1543965 RepID=A0A544T2L9_9BACI|nr:hypothetical protein [Psychrobacillus soli]TQR11690.1 hypothetical protein FG383_13855 [Psychrobacillus soli]